MPEQAPTLARHPEFLKLWVGETISLFGSQITFLALQIGLMFNGALITVQNAMAVLFPAWVRLGPIVTTGVEALGQNVLAMLANLVFLGLGLIVPVVVAFGTVRALHQARPIAISLIVIVSSIILFAETYGAMRFLGRGLARAEPMQST